MRSVTLTALAALALLLSACGGGDPAPAPGSAQNPLTPEATAAATGGRLNEASANTKAPGYQKLLDRQKSRPASRFTPCNLVSKAQARSILGAAVVEPFEAPQGPTCIYRTRTGQDYVTVAVQQTDFAKLKPLVRQRKRFTVADHAGICGSNGQPTLYVPLTGGRVLSIAAAPKPSSKPLAAPCATAQRFATTALQRISG
jgi:hypothetical protein